MLSHAQVWSAIDALAQRFDMTTSALAKLAGLDPTSFNKSKRLSSDEPPRPRWPSTESLSKVLGATGVGFTEFAAMAGGGAGPRRGVPLLGFAEAGADGYFDDAGFPAGQGWEEIDLHAGGDDEIYGLEISGDSMRPVYRDGDRIVVKPTTEPRRGDRVVVKTTGGEVMAKEVARVTARRLELTSLNPDYPGRTLERREIAWVARILWASQ